MSLHHCSSSEPFLSFPGVYISLVSYPCDNPASLVHHASHHHFHYSFHHYHSCFFWSTSMYNPTSMCHYNTRMLMLPTAQQNSNIIVHTSAAKMMTPDLIKTMSATNSNKTVKTDVFIPTFPLLPPPSFLPLPGYMWGETLSFPAPRDDRFAPLDGRRWKIWNGREM